MQKINFEDLPSTNMPIDADNLNDLQDNVEEAIEEVRTELKEFIVVTISDSQNITSNSQVGFNAITRKNGNFTLSNGAIKIGSGINHVRVNGSLFVNNWAGSSNYLWNIIRKNGSNIASSINGSPSSFLSASVPTQIIDVQEDDLITCVADSPAGGQLRIGSENTWLCVEKID